MQKIKLKTKFQCGKMQFSPFLFASISNCRKSVLFDFVEFETLKFVYTHKYEYQLIFGLDFIGRTRNVSAYVICKYYISIFI